LSAWQCSICLISGNIKQLLLQAAEAVFIFITFNIKETMSVPEAVLNLDYSELEADKVK
jgi:hypothetical protein